MPALSTCCEEGGTADQAHTCSSVGGQALWRRCLTMEMWRPRLRCTLQHSSHTSTPLLMEAQPGSAGVGKGQLQPGRARPPKPLFRASTTLSIPHMFTPWVPQRSRSWGVSRHRLLMRQPSSGSERVFPKGSKLATDTAMLFPARCCSSGKVWSPGPVQQAWFSVLQSPLQSHSPSPGRQECPRGHNPDGYTPHSLRHSSCVQVSAPFSPAPRLPLEPWPTCLTHCAPSQTPDSALILPGKRPFHT